MDWTNHQCWTEHIPGWFMSVLMVPMKSLMGTTGKYSLREMPLLHPLGHVELFPKRRYFYVFLCVDKLSTYLPLTLESWQNTPMMNMIQGVFMPLTLRSWAMYRKCCQNTHMAKMLIGRT